MIELISNLFNFSNHQQCPTHVSQVALNLNEKDQTKQKELQFLCNQLLIYSNKQFNYSLIEIDNFNQTHQLKVEKMELTNIVCENCQFGIFRILEIYQQNKETMKLSQIAIKNCRCGNTGCLSIVKSLDEFILKQNLIGPTRILQQHDYDNLHFKLNQQINIVDSSFLNNTAFYGGSILIQLFQKKLNIPFMNFKTFLNLLQQNLVPQLRNVLSKTIQHKLEEPFITEKEQIFLQILVKFD